MAAREAQKGPLDAGREGPLEAGQEASLESPHEEISRGIPWEGQISEAVRETVHAAIRGVRRDDGDDDSLWDSLPLQTPDPDDPDEQRVEAWADRRNFPRWRISLVGLAAAGTPLAAIAPSAS